MVDRYEVQDYEGVVVVCFTGLNMSNVQPTVTICIGMSQKCVLRTLSEETNPLHNLVNEFTTAMGQEAGARNIRKML